MNTTQTDSNKKILLADDYHDMYNIPYGKEREWIGKQNLLEYFQDYFDPEEAQDMTEDEILAIAKEIPDEEIHDFIYENYQESDFDLFSDSSEFKKPTNIIMIGIIQSWKALHPAYKFIETAEHLLDAYREIDSNIYERTLYKEDDSIKMKLTHHDGTNHMELFSITAKGRDKYEKVMNDYIELPVSETQNFIKEMLEKKYITRIKNRLSAKAWRNL